MLMYELSQINNDIPKAEGISPRLASLLYARGARDREAMELFLHPGEGQFLDPLLMKDMDKALERIKRAVASKRYAYTATTTRTAYAPPPYFTTASRVCVQM